MARGQPAVLHRLAHALVQREQAHGVGDGGARLADRRGGVLLRHVIGLNERFVTLGLFDGVQVLALKVFHQRQLHGLLIRNIPHDDGCLGQARHPAGTPTALTGHDEIAVHPVGPHRDGLQQTVL